jgi:hypothetical protein
MTERPSPSPPPEPDEVTLAALDRFPASVPPGWPGLRLGPPSSESGLASQNEPRDPKVDPSRVKDR